MRILSKVVLKLAPGSRAAFAPLVFVPKKTAGNSDKTANFSLFFALQNRRRSRISAATETPTADNLREKQRKQQKRRDVL